MFEQALKVNYCISTVVMDFDLLKKRGPRVKDGREGGIEGLPNLKSAKNSQIVEERIRQSLEKAFLVTSGVNFSFQPVSFPFICGRQQVCSGSQTTVIW